MNTNNKALALKKFVSYKRITIQKNLFNPKQSFSSKLRYESAAFIRSAWNEILAVPGFSENVSLYFHFPFCKDNRCTYCMYYSQISADGTVPETYFKYLEDELEYFSPSITNILIQSLYIGGGTPSLLSRSQIEQLFAKIEHIEFIPKAEKSFEQSFNTTSNEKLSLLRKMGINRLSFGVQSMERAVLKNVNRKFSDLTLIRDLLSHGKSLGFKEINIDLMIGLPGETKGGVTQAIKNLIECGVDSITIYIFRHLKHHLDTIDMDKIENYNSDYIPQMIKIIRAQIVSSGWVDTVNDDRTEYQFFTSQDHWDTYDLVGYRTQADPESKNSVMGFGLTAYSYVQDFFRYENREKMMVFNPENKSYAFDMIKSEDRQRIYVLDKLMRDGVVNHKQFHKQFGKKFVNVFDHELADLRTLKKMKLDAHYFRLIGKDRIENAALSKFFWDQQYLESLDY